MYNKVERRVEEAQFQQLELSACSRMVIACSTVGVWILDASEQMELGHINFTQNVLKIINLQHTSDFVLVETDVAEQPIPNWGVLSLLSSPINTTVKNT